MFPLYILFIYEIEIKFKNILWAKNISESGAWIHQDLLSKTSKFSFLIFLLSLFLLS